MGTIVNALSLHSSAGGLEPVLGTVLHENHRTGRKTAREKKSPEENSKLQGLEGNIGRVECFFWVLVC